jgi:hypothetical protein
MKMKITLTCPCKHYESFEVNVPVTRCDTDPSIVNSINQNTKFFRAKESFESLIIHCDKCNHSKEYFL